MSKIKYILAVAFFAFFALPHNTCVRQAYSASPEEESEREGTPAGNSLVELMESIASQPEIRNALWSVSVRDVKTGEIVLERNQKMNLVPASSLKLFVTAAAMDILGPDKRFKTELYYSGKIHDGTLAGNILIRGGGDPSLGSEMLKNAVPSSEVFAQWLKALKKKGIHKIEGSVIADSSLFEDYQPGSWAWEDIGNYYAAAPAALTIRDNLYRIYFDASDKIGGPAVLLRTEPVVKGLVLESGVTTAEKGSGDNVFIYSFPGIDKAMARGTLPLGAKNFAVKGALPDPAITAATEFTEYLRQNGISVSADPVKGLYEKSYKKAAEYEGVPVKDIAHITNKRSFNLYAELLLRHLSSARGDNPATGDGGIIAIKDFLRRNSVDTSELKMIDACGLSRRNLVNADAFTSMLAAVSKKKYFKEYLETMVFPGDPEAFGHIKRFGKAIPSDNLHIKSGSLNGVRSYAGYLKTKSGRMLSFAFIMNNYAGSASKMDSYQEQVINAIYENR